MAGYIATEGLYSDGEPEELKKRGASRGAAPKRPRGPHRSGTKKPRLAVGGEETDDQDFTEGSSEFESSDESESAEALSNAEVCDRCTVSSSSRFT